MTKIGEAAVAESDPLDRFDLVVGTFREIVGVGAVEGVQVVLGPIPEDAHQGFECRKISCCRIQGEFIQPFSC